MCHQNGRTALYFAAKEGHTEIVKLLLDRGVNADTADEVSNIRLHRQITTMCVLCESSHSNHKSILW